MKTNHKYVINPRFKSWVIAIIIFLTIFYQPGTAQEEHPNWIAYDIGDVWGGGVNSIASEKDTLWIACFEKGLIKLNKITHEYQVYNLKDYGFQQNWAQSIVVDKSGNKWFLSSKGLVKFDGTNMTYYDTLGGLEGETIYSIYIIKDHQENIWVKGSGKIAKYDGQNWEVYSTTDSNSIFYNIRGIGFDSSGHIWAGTQAYDPLRRELVEIYDGKRIPVILDELINFLDNCPPCGILDIQISKDGTKWIIINNFFSGWMSLAKIIDESKVIITEGNLDYYDFLPDGFFLTIESDSSFWLGGNDYFRWYDGNESYKYYTFRRGIHDDGVGNVIIDEYGNKWFPVYDFYQQNPNYPTYIVCFREGGVKLGVDENAQVTQSQLYPNPAWDYIYVNSPLIDGAGGVWQYQIYDILGNCVQSGAIESEKININQLSSGFYTVRFFNAGKQVVEKLMKE